MVNLTAYSPYRSTWKNLKATHISAIASLLLCAKTYVAQDLLSNSSCHWSLSPLSLFSTKTSQASNMGLCMHARHQERKRHNGCRQCASCKCPELVSDHLYYLLTLWSFSHWICFTFASASTWLNNISISCTSKNLIHMCPLSDLSVSNKQWALQCVFLCLYCKGCHIW
jgi:hypothetical protein